MSGTEPLESEAQQLMSEVLSEHRIAYLDQFICTGCKESFGNVGEATAHQSAEIDKALGGIARVWGVQMIGDEDVTIGSEGTARYCARQHPTSWKAMSHWASSWTEVPGE